MGELSQELQYKGRTIKINYEDSPMGPREWDNGCVMVCQHKRYTLGDTQYNSACANNWKEWFAEYVMENFSPISSNHYDEQGYLDDSGVARVWKWIDSNMVVLSVNMYEHSGITLSTSSGYPYNDRWDAGQVGYAYMTKQMIFDTFQTGKNLTQKLRERAVALIEAEVSEYDQYVRGEVYEYAIGEDDEYCGGYYSEKDAIAEAKSVIDYYENQKRIARFSKLKKMIRSGVDLISRALILEEQYKIYV